MLSLHNMIVTVAAQSLPHISPNTNSPISGPLTKLADFALGVMALVLVVAFFYGFFLAATSFASKRQDGGIARGVFLSAACVIVLALIYAGASGLNKWTSFLGL